MNNHAPNGYSLIIYTDNLDQKEKKRLHKIFEIWRIKRKYQKQPMRVTVKAGDGKVEMRIFYCEALGRGHCE